MSFKMSVDEVAADLVRIRYLFANLYMQGTPDNWVLIDAGVPGGTDDIIRVAQERFGTAPQSIILTHGHFDHVGAFPEIFERWDVAVLAHVAEVPHMTGVRDYPEPDPMIGKGVMAVMSVAYPRKAIDLGIHVKPLPDDGTIPDMPGWRWVHTPGHTDGHISLFRDEDRVLIAGDAFVTTQQESLYQVMRQKQGVHGPPAYFTPDWIAARASVEKLAALNPTIAATGHGTPMRGNALAQGLADLSANFDEIAVPDYGRYSPKGDKTSG
jgi:glyoxylase-like metal-dependent hydrolase (beta-lactamase superfamily II)